MVAQGQQCLNNEGTPQRTPRRLMSGSITSFAAGWRSSYIVLPSGSIQSCGLNEDGQLGDGTNDNKSESFVDLDDVTSEIIGVYAGLPSKSAFFEADDGKVYSTGLNNRGQLGIGNRNSRNSPVEVEMLGGGNGGINIISSSDTHTLAIRQVTSSRPTRSPAAPTGHPAGEPTVKPTRSPMAGNPTLSPSVRPSGSPSGEPSEPPSEEPSVSKPTTSPTWVPTETQPTYLPTMSPMINPNRQ